MANVERGQLLNFQGVRGLFAPEKWPNPQIKRRSFSIRTIHFVRGVRLLNFRCFSCFFSFFFVGCFFLLHCVVRFSFFVNCDFKKTFFFLREEDLTPNKKIKTTPKYIFFFAKKFPPFTKGGASASVSRYLRETLWAMKLLRIYRGWKITQVYRDYHKPL